MRILDRLGLEDEVDEAVYAAALRKNEETRRDHSRVRRPESAL
jgi:hypothetical protein